MYKSFFIILFFVASSVYACELRVGADEIKLIKEEKGCEFPEGNKVDCAYFSVTVGNKTRTSSVVFRKNTDLKSFCLTAKEGKRELSPFKDANIFLDCTQKTSEMHFQLKLSSKVKECKFTF